jgi:hypothetical protein
MSWWQIVILCYVFYALGIINATVAERNRYWTWMHNSWELINRKLWWLKMVKAPADVPTPQDYNDLTQNLIGVFSDYQEVFGRQYQKEKLLSVEVSIGEGDSFNE